MAANSGGTPSTGVDWNSIIKPFVNYSVGSLLKQEFQILLKAVVDRYVVFNN